MRWIEEATRALNAAGYALVESDGVCDYQGWGVLLGRNATGWAVLAWSYGSCSYCDSFEGMGDAELRAAFAGLIETAKTESEARRLFDSRKGW